MKEAKLFGTDGIRAPHDDLILNEDSIKKLGLILYFLYKPKKVFIGQDTRHSGQKIANNIISSLESCGVYCSFAGVIPTGTVSFITKEFGYDLGIMISASHNPYTDNGIKIFNKDGYKISREDEQKIENLYFNTETGYYISHIKNSFKIFDQIINYKIIFDCANGAASLIIDALFSQYKNIKIIKNKPNGYNINLDSGSEYLENIKKEVLKEQADLGIAFDGDADRVVFVNEKGEQIDGDAVLALMAIELNKQGKLKDHKMVATVMSSQSLDKALMPYNIVVFKTEVGDKNVSDFLAKNNYNFGGENSGHIVLHDHCSSGDGIIAACYFLEIFFNQNKQASNLFNFYQKTPTVLKNIMVNKKIPLEKLPNTTKAIIEANNELNGLGRVFFRYSGTENKARLLVEAPTENECHKLAKKIIDIFNSEQE